MWLQDWNAPVWPGATVAKTARLAASYLAGCSFRDFAAQLRLTPGNYAVAPLGVWVPSRHALASAADDSELGAMLGVLIGAAYGNVAGQRGNLRRAMRTKQTAALAKIVNVVLDFVTWSDEQRALIPWEKAPSFVPAHFTDLATGKIRTDAVTRRDRKCPYFFYRAVGDLVLFLCCCEKGITLSFVAAQNGDNEDDGRYDFASIPEAMRYFYAAPPRVSAVYAVPVRAAALPPPFIPLYRPFAAPTTAAGQAAWRRVWAALHAYSVGDCFGRDVKVALAAAAAVAEPAPRTVLETTSLRWLASNQALWGALARRESGVKGPVALFTEKALPPEI